MRLICKFNKFSVLLILSRQLTTPNVKPKQQKLAQPTSSACAASTSSSVQAKGLRPFGFGSGGLEQGLVGGSKRGPGAGGGGGGGGGCGVCILALFLGGEWDGVRGWLIVLLGTSGDGS